MVLPFQQAFIDRVLSISLAWDHVLYCMDNETSGSSEWSLYWCEYVRTRAREAGAAVQTTEMWDEWDVTAETHDATFDHPGLYSFIDISHQTRSAGNEWMFTPITAKTWGRSDVTMTLRDQYDAILFVDTVRAPTYR